MSKVSSLLDILKGFEVVDLSPLLENGIPRWPTHPPLVINPTCTHEHDNVGNQTVFMSEHCGAHVDSPTHKCPDKMDRSIDVFPANYICGRAVVYNLEGHAPGERIPASEIIKCEEKMGVAAGENDIVLLNFGYFKYWTAGPEWLYYAKNEPGLDEDACKLFYDRKVRAVGSDTIACDTPVDDGYEHYSYGHLNYWLPNEILIMEELMNLDKLPSECYFVATPLKIKNGTGSPIRPFALVPKN